MDMETTEWIQQRYGLDLGADGTATGAALEQALYRALVAARCDYALQKEILYEASGHHHDLAFGQACLDRIDNIVRFEQRRAALQVRKTRRCHSGVAKNKDWAPGAEYADRRFQPARTPTGELCTLLDDMAARLVERNYIEARPDVARDLRQGLGYYRRGEDIFRRRRTVKWLKGQNALHCWVAAALDPADPLSRVGEGRDGCWVVAADLFLDRHGRAFTYSRLEHGVMRDRAELEWLRRTIPRSPSDPPNGNK